MAVRAVEPLDGIAGRDLAGLEHAHVEAGTARGREALHPLRLAHTRREGRAGNARRGRLDERRADPEAVADPDVAGAEARERQVLAERAGRRLRAELARPPGVVLGGVEVEGLVGPAVVFLVDDRVAGETEGADV